MKRLPLAILAALFAAVAWGYWHTTAAHAERDAALARLGRMEAMHSAVVVELEQLQEANDSSEAARVAAEARADSLAEDSRRRRAESQRIAAAASQSSLDAEGRLRATLTAAGLPTADVDSVADARERAEASRHEEVAALESELHGVRWQLEATEDALDRMREYADGERRRADAAEGLDAIRAGLQAAAEAEAARARTEAKVWKVLAIAEAGGLAWAAIAR